MKQVILLPILCLTCACASYAAPDAPVDSAPAEPDYVEREAGADNICDAEPAQYHVGHDATQEMGAIILKESGAAQLRWGPPDSAWTMDYRQDRVNVRYDRDMKITAVSCG